MSQAHAPQHGLSQGCRACGGFRGMGPDAAARHLKFQFSFGGHSVHFLFATPDFESRHQHTNACWQARKLEKTPIFAVFELTTW